MSTTENTNKTPDKCKNMGAYIGHQITLTNKLAEAATKITRLQEELERLKLCLACKIVMETCFNLLKIPIDKIDRL